MQIDELRISRLDIPFKLNFRHASAERARMQSVWAEARGNGLPGIGEGCPRRYVTGETLASAEEFCRGVREAVVREIHSLDDLRAWQADRADAIDAHPAAWCALELALLDLLAREHRVPVEDLLGLPRLRRRFFYSAVLGDSEFPLFLITAARYRALGLKDFKFKLSGNLAADKRKLKTLRKLGIEKERIRVDANNFWKDAREAAEYLTALGPIAAIEEPLASGDFEGMRLVAERTGARIVLDESTARSGWLPRIAGDPGRWMVNIRISKMGGLLRSLDVLKHVREMSIPVVVGAQVGETSVLTRAALPAAQAAGEALYAQEGAFGTRLLQHDICSRPVMFGFGGALDTRGFGFSERAGWGLAARGKITQTVNLQE